MLKIFVIVQNGEATVRTDTVPPDVKVEIIDLDLIRCGESFPSPEAFKYCADHQIFEERRRGPKQSVSTERRETADATV